MSDNRARCYYVIIFFTWHLALPHLCPVSICLSPSPQPGLLNTDLNSLTQTLPWLMPQSDLSSLLRVLGRLARARCYISQHSLLT